MWLIKETFCLWYITNMSVIDNGKFWYHQLEKKHFKQWTRRWAWHRGIKQSPPPYRNTYPTVNICVNLTNITEKLCLFIDKKLFVLLYYTDNSAPYNIVASTVQCTVYTREIFNIVPLSHCHFIFTNNVYMCTFKSEKKQF